MIRARVAVAPSEEIASALAEIDGAKSREVLLTALHARQPPEAP